jgi:hypothetical protein
MPPALPFDDASVDDAQLPAAAFLARCQGRTLNPSRIGQFGTSATLL